MEKVKVESKLGINCTLIDQYTDKDNIYYGLFRRVIVHNSGKSDIQAVIHIMDPNSVATVTMKGYRSFTNASNAYEEMTTLKEGQK